jgi:hypothetical protein
MSATSRYKVFIPSIIRLYTAPDSLLRTNALCDGLLALADSGDWSIAQKDAARLLSVWVSKESNTTAADVVNEIKGIFTEFIETSLPTLSIKDAVITESIQHVAPSNTVEEEEEEEELESEIETEDSVEDAEGIEVEKRRIRGVDYWYDPSSRKLYTICDEDDVGDEVGILLPNGNPVMIAP